MENNDSLAEGQEKEVFEAGQKVSRSVALTEINEWLDVKKVTRAKRNSETFADVLEKLVEAVMFGQLSVQETTKQLTQHLDFPLEIRDANNSVTGAVSELKFKNRVTEEEVSTKIKSAKGDDTMTIMRAYIAAATSQPMALIGKLDVQDIALSRSVASFFM